MDGPVLSGGVIVLVAAALWMLYLLPSWRGRQQFYAAERNAVRMNQALRVLAETSETPSEVRLELTTRTAHAQQRLAKRVQAERAAAELELLRAELVATRSNPAVRQARARRRVRLAALTLAVGGVIAAGFGIWQSVTGGGFVVLAAGIVVTGAAGLVLQRMARVAGRAVSAASDAAAPVSAPRISPPLHDQGRPTTWTPRPLPEPLVSVEGSRAHAAQAFADAQRARRAAAQAEELRKRAETMAPPAPVELAASDLSRMGYVDDAEIEAHVRRVLARRAAG